jgi:putative flippase GtrA
VTDVIARITRPSSVVGRFVPERVQRHIAKLIRYTATSVVSLGVSEIVLVALYWSKTFDATVSALIATLTGTVPSYLLSRYWIWAKASRARVGRQVVLYWITSFVAMGITSISTGLITATAPKGHHVLFASGGFLFMNVVLWLAKYAVYQKVIFKEHHREIIEVA